MPEPFLWDTFYHMVEAAVVMSDSPKDYGLEFEIVHRDIKPSNCKNFHIGFLKFWDNYSTIISIFRRRERRERVLFLPSC